MLKLHSNYRDRLERRWADGKFVCFGLDPVYDRMPSCIRSYASLEEGKNNLGTVCSDIAKFGKSFIEPTKDTVAAYKPNTAFYERFGWQGWKALSEVIAEIKRVAPEVPIILDAKRADIGNTNEGYAEMAFDQLGADAITVHPYFGHEAMEPFLRRSDKGIIVLCRTSNNGAGEFQDLIVNHRPTQTLYQRVAENVSNKNKWNQQGNCSVVVGATYPEELVTVRGIVGDMPILIPGIGAQGGDLESAVKGGMNSHGTGHIVSTSSGAMFASTQPDYTDDTVRVLEETNNGIIATVG